MKHDSKVRLRRCFLSILVTAGVILLLSVLFDMTPGTEKIAGKTNEQRVEYLRSVGWDVSEVPIREQIIRLPKEFPEVLKKYNELQIEQGFDMMRYAGKEIKMYTYNIQNCQPDSPKQAVVYVYKNKIIGGDVHSPAFDGKMEPLQ